MRHYITHIITRLTFFTVRSRHLSLPVISGFVILFFPQTLYGADLTQAFNARHKTCLERIAEDADLAFEKAMIWRDEGGGRRARHCVAMAIFALGHKEEAARRLENLAKSPDGGSLNMRVNFYAEATNFWLLADKPVEAIRAATAGLDIQENDVPLHIARARAYALAGHYDDADRDLTSALTFEPDNPNILRYRADARQHLGKLTEAKTDIERALELSPNTVETALLRGHIHEAIRLSKLKDANPIQ